MSGLADLLEAQAEAMMAAFLAARPDGVVLSYNARFSSLWGIPADVLALGTITALTDWLLSTGDAAAITLAALLTSSDPPETGQLQAADSRACTYRVVPIGDGGGRLWAFQDADELRHLTAGLRDADHLLQILEAHIEGVVLELDEEARIVGIWATNDTFFEDPDADLQGKRLADVVGGEQGAAFEAVVQNVFAASTPKPFEYSREVGGVQRFFAAEARVMPGDVEAPRVTVMIRDVTERTRMQSQLLESERLASVGLLAAGVAHEVNNPLAYTLLNLERILNGVQALAVRLPDEKLDGLVDAARMSLEGGRRVQTIVNDLRRFSRSEPHEPRVPVDVRRVLDFAIVMASHQTRDRAKVVREFGDVPLVLASENRLSQIFLNLLVNAAQAIPEGNPDANEIRVVTRTDATGRAVIEVYDTGEGMSSSVMRQIFEPFFTTKPAGVGTGLGLAICHGIATSLGGKLAVESQQGRGSVFRLLLPSAEAGAAG